KGIYLGLDEKSTKPHSYRGLPDRGYQPLEKGNWMVRVTLKGKGKADEAKSLKAQRRKLLDKQTRKDVAKIDLSFASWFHPEDRYELASNSRKKVMIRRWIKDAQSDDLKKRTRAIAALGNVKAKPAVETLIEIAEEPMDNNRPKWMAVRALGEIGDKSAVPTLIGLVDHDNWDTNVYARAVLAQITGVYFGEDKPKWREWWKKHGQQDSNAEEQAEFRGMMNKAHEAYIAMVGAYEKKDWPGVDKFADDVSDTIDDLSRVLDVDLAREQFKRSGRKDENYANTLDERERLKRGAEALLGQETRDVEFRRLLTLIDELADDVHDHAGSGEIDKIPAKYEKLLDAWSVLWKRLSPAVENPEK
ncbi:MAG TPA: HEAT repeat domain-containing protein, partial [Phycisphaerae bacterium]|nr:HEAT repeat domain-containing protein [Phycisphaerae bacterium]